MEIKDSKMLSAIFKHGKLSTSGEVNSKDRHQEDYETPEHKAKVKASA
jgi:hypothetical protein